MNRYQIRFAPAALEDLERLYDFLLTHDLAVAERAVQILTQAWKLLEQFPFTCRKAAQGRHGPLLRELVIPFGASGYVALFRIDNAKTVTVLAVRHQRESDYH